MLLRWIIWAERALLLTVLLAVGLLTFLNVRDYRRYKFITELERHVTPEQFAAMAQVCADSDRRGFERHDRERDSRPFAVLSPIGLSLGRGSGEVKPYERGNAYAYLSFSSIPRNSRAYLFYDFDGRGQQGREVWLRCLEAEAQFSPEDRVLTLIMWTLGPDREFVVTKDSLMVFSRNGGWSELVGRRELPEPDVQRLRNAVGRIGQEHRGKAYKAGGLDGCMMVFRFSGDGTPSDQDIRVENTWCDALNEVTAVLAELVPTECPLPPREWMPSPTSDSRQRIVPISEVNRSNVPLNFPWWLIWPRLVLGVKG